MIIAITLWHILKYLKLWIHFFHKFSNSWNKNISCQKLLMVISIFNDYSILMIHSCKHDGLLKGFLSLYNKYDLTTNQIKMSKLMI